jgi:polysaccharide pyruvyl transferase WcaK-like protein
MIIEIKGIGIPNKGAELMLVAAKEQLQSVYPDAIFVVEPNTAFIGRSRFGLHQKVWLKFMGFQIGRFASLIPKRIREKFGLIIDSEIDVVIDASGFTYGDQWGAEKAKRRLVSDIRRWKDNGKKVILLPQAFGPFKDEALKKNMQVIQQYSDVIFARDDISFKYMAELGGQNLQQAPDFTNLVTGVVPNSFSATPKDICVIPNSKMIEMTSDAEGAEYPKQMINVISYCQLKGYTPYLLVHEGEKDDDLAELINSGLELKVPVYRFESPREIKGIIGTAHIVISSRFHGIVSALSQGIPAVATGWSHKYEMLMQDYGCIDLLLDGNNKSLESCVEPLLDDVEYSNYCQQISVRSDALKEESRGMWKKVFNIIDS